MCCIYKGTVVFKRGRQFQSHEQCMRCIYVGGISAELGRLRAVRGWSGGRASARF